MNYNDIFICGILIGIGIFVFFEYFIINFIYLKNLDFYNVFMITKKNRDRLEKYYGDKK